MNTFVVTYNNEMYVIDAKNVKEALDIFNSNWYNFYDTAAACDISVKKAKGNHRINDDRGSH